MRPKRTGFSLNAQEVQTSGECADKFKQGLRVLHPRPEKPGAAQARESTHAGDIQREGLPGYTGGGECEFLNALYRPIAKELQGEV
ncbi:MAG TPA: hypothetical protein VFP94_07565 [Terriglobales bacterium]|nr:hypothetical protein [Terriglobales bacterium]